MDDIKIINIFVDLASSKAAAILKLTSFAHFPFEQSGSLLPLNAAAKIGAWVFDSTHLDSFHESPLFLKAVTAKAMVEVTAFR